MSRPLVTIGIPAYNGGRYLEETLRSILAQTYPNLEILISDNASTDDTPQVVKRFSDSRIVYHRNPATVSAEDNYNVLITMAKGEYLSIFHADDIYSPRIVEKEVEFLEAHPEAGAVFTLMELINEDGEKLKKTKRHSFLPPELPGNASLAFSKVFPAVLSHGNVFLGCPTNMVRRSIYEAVGLFNNKSFGTSADLEMWLRISERASIGILSERLMKYRIHSKSGSSCYQAARIDAADFFKTTDRYMDSPALKSPPDETTLRQHAFHQQRDRLRRAVNLLAQGRIPEARTLLDVPWPEHPIQACLENWKVAYGLLGAVVIKTAAWLGAGGFIGRLLHHLTYGGGAHKTS